MLTWIAAPDARRSPSLTCTWPTSFCAAVALGLDRQQLVDGRALFLQTVTGWPRRSRCETNTPVTTRSG